MDFSLLNRASITYEYLHTNSTTHEFLFGAVAELVDNARDAQAKTVHIDYGSGQFSFLDDGCGMDQNEVASIVSFGYSTKRLDPNMVGQYGNGLKSGAMRIGKDFILFTKKEGLMTCMMLSRTFHEEHNLKEVIVPTPSFLEDRRPYYEKKQNVQKHAMEMQIIYKYSPFHSADELFSQFARITSDTGTLVVCYNLRRVEGGAYEMDFTTDTVDVRLTDHLPHREEEKNSLRAYLSILYMNPRMRIYLRGNKVDTKRILSTLYKPRMYRCQAKNLKACAERELEKCEKKAQELIDRVSLCKSEVVNFELTYPRYMTDPSLRVQYRILVKALDDVEEMLAITEKRTKMLQKSKLNPSPLVFYFGLNIHHRDRYGCMVYNNGRLIRMYEKLAAQKEKNDNMMKYLGVVAVVDIPYSILEPTHNKQSFENKREYANVLKSLNDHLIQYWTDVSIGATVGGVASFWKNFGYDSTAWDATGSQNAEFVRKRAASVGMSVQCDICLKWRHLDFHPSLFTTGIAKDWRCAMHPNSLFRYCSKLEELPKIPEGRLMKLPDKPPVTCTKSRQNNSKKVVEGSGSRGSVKAKAQKHSPSHSVAGQSSRPTRQAAQQANYRELSESDHEMELSSSRRPSKTSRSIKEKSRVQKCEEADLPSTSISELDTAPTQERKSAKTKAMVREQRDRELAKKSEWVELSKLSATNSVRKLPKKIRQGESTPLQGNHVLRKVAECLADSPETKRPKKHDDNRATDLEAHMNSSLDGETSAASGSESVMIVAEPPESPQSSETAVTSSQTDDKERMDKVIRKLNYLVNFFKPSTMEKKEIKNTQDAIDFDLRSYLNAYKSGLDQLITDQVRKRLDEHLGNVIKLVEWSCPEMNGQVTRSNVFSKLEELLTLI